MGKKSILLLMFILLAILPLINAVPPVMTEFKGTEGLDVEANFQEYYKINEGAEISIFVFNKSNGDKIFYPDATCAVELTDRNGTKIMSGTATPDGEHFQMIRPASVVSESGSYAITVVCNTSNLAGYKTAFFEANILGIAYTQEKSTTYMGIILFLTILLGGFVYGSVTIPYKDFRGVDGELMGVNDLKYLKLICMFFAYGMLVWISNILVHVSNNLLQDDIMFGFFSMIFLILSKMFYPLFIAMVIFIITKSFQDKKNKNLLGDGFKI